MIKQTFLLVFSMQASKFGIAHVGVPARKTQKTHCCGMDNGVLDAYKHLR